MGTLALSCGLKTAGIKPLQHSVHFSSTPLLTLWSASVWPVSLLVWPVLLSVWPVLVGPVPAMMGDVKVSLGLRAGCRLTLPTCIEHNGGHGAMTPARTTPLPHDTDLLAVPCPPALGVGGWQCPCAVREQVLVELLDRLWERGWGEMGVPKIPQILSCCSWSTPGQPRILAAPRPYPASKLQLLEVPSTHCTTAPSRWHPAVSIHSPAPQMLHAAPGFPNPAPRLCNPSPASRFDLHSSPQAGDWGLTAARSFLSPFAGEVSLVR